MGKHFHIAQESQLLIHVSNTCTWTVTHGLTIGDCNREVAALKRCLKCTRFRHLELEPRDCNRLKVAALITQLMAGHYMQVTHEYMHLPSLTAPQWSSNSW